MVQQRRILVTGGSGKVGSSLIPRLVQDGHALRLLLRRRIDGIDESIDQILVDDLCSESVPANAFDGIDLLIHLAAEVSVGKGDPVDDSVNVRMAHRLSARARDAGIGKILLLSSIFAEVCERTPQDCRRYGAQKLAADKVFRESIAHQQRLVILRPPAIYGEHMGGQLRTLIKLIKKGIPLPLGLATNPRNYMSIDNLTSLLGTIAAADDDSWQRADGQDFMPSDGAVISTSRLVTMMAEAVGKSGYMLPVPVSMLRLAGKLTGKENLISGAVDRLDISDNGPLQDHFGWQPHIQMPESLAYLKQ